MKRVLSCMLALVIVLSLCACGSGSEKVKVENTEREPTQYRPTDSAIDKAKPDLDGKVQDDDRNPPKDISGVHGAGEEPIYVASEEDMLQFIIEAVREDELNDVYPVSTGEDTEMFLQLIGLSSNYVDAIAIAFPMMSVHAYTIAIAKPAPNGEDPITGAFNAYRNQQMDSFEQYLVDQYEVASSAQIFTAGQYICLVMCDDAQTVADGIRELLETADSRFAIDPEKAPVRLENMNIVHVFDMNEKFLSDPAAAEAEHTFEWFCGFHHSDNSSVLQFEVDYDYLLTVAYEGDSILDITLSLKDDPSKTVDVKTGNVRDFVDNKY